MLIDSDSILSMSVIMLAVNVVSGVLGGVVRCRVGYYCSRIQTKRISTVAIYPSRLKIISEFTYCFAYGGVGKVN